MKNMYTIHRSDINILFYCKYFRVLKFKNNNGKYEHEMTIDSRLKLD